MLLTDNLDKGVNPMLDNLLTINLTPYAASESLLDSGVIDLDYSDYVAVSNIFKKSKGQSDDSLLISSRSIVKFAERYRMIHGVNLCRALINSDFPWMTCALTSSLIDSEFTPVFSVGST
jgi:hypothetical protein